MRQAGIIAAGALYALEHHVERLAEDHANAARLAEVIRGIEGLSLSPAQVDTNIVTFDVAPELGTAAEFVGRLAARGVRMFAIGPSRIRAVTHLDVGAADVDRAAILLDEAAQEAASGLASPAPAGPSYG